MDFFSYTNSYGKQVRWWRWPVHPAQKVSWQVKWDVSALALNIKTILQELSYLIVRNCLTFYKLVRRSSIAYIGLKAYLFMSLTESVLLMALNYSLLFVLSFLRAVCFCEKKKRIFLGHFPSRLVQLHWWWSFVSAQSAVRLESTSTDSHVLIACVATCVEPPDDSFQRLAWMLYSDRLDLWPHVPPSDSRTRNCGIYGTHYH